MNMGLAPVPEYTRGVSGDPARVRPRATFEDGGVGQELRARRTAKGLSLRALARELDISPSALSQIETGKSRPSVSTLYAIVSALGMSLDELFGGAPRPAPGPPPGAAQAPSDPDELVQRADGRSAIQLETGVRWERLTPAHDAAADFLYVVYEPGGSSSAGDEFIRHTGREYGLVLSGVLEVSVGFQTYHLGPGDSISFDSTTPHRLRNTGTVPAQGVWFVTGRGGDVRTQGFAAPAEPS
jgi:transcriptional regulator with XRE-family HTH domain